MVGINFKSLHSNRAQIRNCLNTKYLLKEKQETIQNGINLNCDFASFKILWFLYNLYKIYKMEVILSTSQ